MKINVFGRVIEVLRENNQWVLYSLGDGKKRVEKDIVIPSELNESEVVTYVADIFHELATPQNSDVRRIGEV